MTVPLYLVRFSGSFAVILQFLVGNLRLAAAEPAVPFPADHAERFTRGLEQFRKEIRPLLTTHCLKCHGGEKTQSDFSLASREDLLKGGAEGLAIRLFDGPGSKLVRLVSRTDKPHMPSKGEPLPETSAKALSEWIHNGAP